MAQKWRIFILLGANTLILYGLVLFLLPEGETQQYVVIGIAALLMMIAPDILINLTMNRLQRELDDATGELKATKEELSKVRENLSSITTIDELTGCYNKSHFVDVLTQHNAMSVRGSYYFSLAVVQIDQFDEIVDKHGLASGNEVLQLYTRIVKAALREVDVVARVGQDLFGLLLSGATEDDAVMILNRVSSLIGQIQIGDDEDLKITNSGGVTSYHGTESAEDLLAHAQIALDFAVEEGRDRVAGYLYEEPEVEVEEASAE